MVRFAKARWFVIVPLTAVSSLGFMRAMPATNRPVCEMASEWVAARRGNLPSTFREIRGYPTLYQRTIYGNLTPARRTTIWQEKLNRLGASDSGLTAEQREVVAIVLHRLPEYTNDSNGLLNAIETRQDGIGERIHATFDQAAVHRIFGALDESADTSMQASQQVGVLKQAGIVGRWHSLVDVISRLVGTEPATAAFSACSCYSGDVFDDNCPFGTRCEKRPNDHCTGSIVPNCGFGNDDVCDGLCYF